jgi:hypothetical protein
MKKSLIATFAALLFVLVPVSAQTFQEGFFLDGYTLGFRYNPAISNESGFIGGVQYSNQSRNNFGAASFLYPTEDGGLVTAFHKSIPAQTFLNSLPDDNYVNGAIDFSIFSYGWRRGENYHTVEASVKGIYDVTVPKEIFQIAKLGTKEHVYDLSGFGMGFMAYAELAYGYSRQLSDIVSVGARAKLLVGLEALRYEIDRFDMSFSEDQYTASVGARLDFTNRMGKFKTDEEGYMSLLSLNAKDKLHWPSGGGLAVDLGVVVTPVEGLTISASALNLGAMIWYYGNAGQSSGAVTFSGFDDLTLDVIKSGKITQELKPLGDEFLSAMQMWNVKKRVCLETVPFTLTAAVKYAMPFYNALSIGATGDFVHWAGGMSYKEFRGCLAWNLCRKLGITGNIGAGDYGMVWGAALTVGIHKFHLNAGMESGFGGTIPYRSTPLKPNNKCLTVGLTYDL